MVNFGYAADVKLIHLNCGSLFPLGYPLLPKLWVCHCLLIDFAGRLILIDTGLGTGDIAHEEESLGQAFLNTARPGLNVEECALTQIKNLGYKPEALSDIVL